MKLAMEKFAGTFKNVVKQADNSAGKLLELVLENFQCSKNQKLGLYERVQILVVDVWACFQNKGLGHFKDIDEISAFANYRVLKIFLWYGMRGLKIVRMRRLISGVASYKLLTF